MDIENTGRDFESDIETGSSIDKVQTVADEIRAKARFEDDKVDYSLEARANAGTETFGELMAKRVERRTFLKGAAAVGALPVVAGAASTALTEGAAANSVDTLTFTPIAGSTADDIIVPTNYDWNTIIAWGDSLDGTTPSLTDAQILAGEHLSAEGAANQANQFGYNCDAAEFFALPTRSSAGTNSGLICVNHEFPTNSLLFDFGAEADPANTLDRRNYDGFSRFNVPLSYYEANPTAADFMKNTLGVTIAEIQKTGNEWSLVAGSPFNRRLTLDTVFRLSGPAARSELVSTNSSPSGQYVFGTYNNCAAGGTPYGTFLTCEENFDGAFGNFGALEARLGSSTSPEVIRWLEMHRRISPNFGSSGQSSLGLEGQNPRYDVNVEPKEAFRYGWVCEVDPYSPNSVPVKRTALGRFKHECATTITSSDNKLVVYMGDDARFEYVYKFVSNRDVVAGNLRANLGLLDDGTLYVAKFNDDGTGEWLAVDYDSQTALQTATIGDTGVATFRSQADVLVGTRIAGDILGATPMDRPEDVEANPTTGKCYICCTNNTRRTEEASIGTRQGREVEQSPNVPNPRFSNSFGHIVEITEAGGVNSATTFNWEIFLLGGDPASSEGRFLTQEEDLNDTPLQPGDTYYAGYADASTLAPIGSPDNICFDNGGNMFIITDGGQPTGNNNGTFAVPTEGANRGFLRQFMSSAVDSEVCGGEFTPDNTTLFLNIQHPGDGGTIGAATSDFPNGGGAEPRPSLIGVFRTDGGVVGS